MNKVAHQATGGVDEEVIHMSEVTSGKKTYETPRLEKFGTVSELTLAGQTNPGQDFAFSGSVNPGPPGRP